MKIREILNDINDLKEELLAFERKYGVRSETFCPAYMSGEEPEDDSWVLDFGEWASVYSTWLSRQAEYRNEVQRLQHNVPSLVGLIQAAACSELIPTHKHIPPDIKHNRIPAPGMSFAQPNLLKLIPEIELFLQQLEN